MSRAGLSLALWVGVLAACASAPERSAKGAAPPAPAPSAPALSEPPPSLALFEQLLLDRRARRAEQGFRCWAGEGCDPVDDELARAREREVASEVLRAGWRGEPRGEALLRAAARAALEEATAAVTDEARRHAAGFVLWDDEAPFALGDLSRLLAEAPRERRAELLACAAPFVAAQAARHAAARAARAAAARAVRLDEAGLLAVRVGLSPDALAALAAEGLQNTRASRTPAVTGVFDVPALGRAARADLDEVTAFEGPVLSGIRAEGAARDGVLPACFLIDPPNDVRLIGEPMLDARAARYAKGCVVAGRLHPRGELLDPVWVHAVGLLFRDGVWRSQERADDPIAAARFLELARLAERRAALEVLALLTGPVDGPALDALASRWLADDAPGVPGAAALFAFAADGAAVDALVAHRVARTLSQTLAARFGPGWHQADSEGVARLLVEEAARFRREGPAAFLR